MSPVSDFKETLGAFLRDPANAAAYLTAVLEEGDCEAFALALKDVAEALSGPVPRASTDALCDLKPYLEKVGLRLTISTL